MTTTPSESTAQAVKSKTDLIAETRAMVVSVNNSNRQIADNLAVMRDHHGMTQQDIGEAMEKTQAWVSIMLKWRDDGFVEETPFGSFSKASRKRRKAEAANYKATNNPQPEPTPGPLAEPRVIEEPAKGVRAEPRAESNVLNLDDARPSSGDPKSDRNEAELMAAFASYWPGMNAASRTRFVAHVLNKTRTKAG